MLLPRPMRVKEPGQRGKGAGSIQGCLISDVPVTEHKGPTYRGGRVYG